MSIEVIPPHLDSGMYSDTTARSRGHTGFAVDFFYSIKKRYIIQFVPQIVSMKQNSFPQNKCCYRGK